jgi:hypothetical protein
MPTRETEYIWERRITDTTTQSERTGRRANKEYTVRVYRYPDGNYGTIAFYGRINGTLQMDWKGSSAQSIVAIQVASQIINDKLNSRRSNYENAEPLWERRAPGVPAGDLDTGRARQTPETESDETPSRDFYSTHTIRSRGGRVLYSTEATSLKDCVEQAVRENVDLSNAVLIRADLDGANLYEAILGHADLYAANLSGANLIRANLIRANLYGSNLSGANLSEAVLIQADITDSNVSDANFLFANLYGATDFNVDFRSAVNTDTINRTLPREETEQQEETEPPEPTEEETHERNIETASDLLDERKYDEILANFDYLQIINNLIMDYDGMEEPLQSSLEDFVHHALNSEHKDELLNGLTQHILDKVKMTQEDRNIVSEFYQQEPQETFRPSALGELFGSKKNWYKESQANVMNELAGYFKYIIKSDPNETGIFDIEWKGFGAGLRITSHNMPDALFKEHYDRIKNAAQQKSEEAYQEVTESYALEEQN